MEEASEDADVPLLHELAAYLKVRIRSAMPCTDSKNRAANMGGGADADCWISVGYHFLEGI